MGRAKPSNVEQIFELSKETFKEHVITRNELSSDIIRYWRFQKPGTWNYGFDVHTIPGWIFLSGDIGHLAISREADMLPWCMGVIAEPTNPSRIDYHYVASKVPHELQTKCWTEHAANKDLAHAIKLLDLPRSERLNLPRRVDDETEWRDVQKQLYEDFHLDEIPSGTEFAPGFVWCVLGLRAFLLALKPTL